MPDPTNDIDALIEFLATASQEPFYYTATHNAEKYHAALTALVAERDSLRAEIAAAYRDRASSKSVLANVIAERDALRERVAELEAQPPASDLRERLVCAIWPEILRQWREYKDAIDPRGCARSDALEEAEKMLAAMRKGNTNA